VTGLELAGADDGLFLVQDEGMRVGELPAGTDAEGVATDVGETTAGWEDEAVFDGLPEGVNEGEPGFEDGFNGVDRMGDELDRFGGVGVGLGDCEPGRLLGKTVEEE